MTTTLEIIWDIHNQYIIRDVHEKAQERVRNFMLEKYFIPHRLYNQINFQEDPEVNKEYLKYLDHILRDECSIVVLDEDKNTIHAIALVKCMTRDWRSWTSLQLCVDQSKFTDIIELQYRMINEYANEHPDEVFDSLHLFEYYMDDDLKYDYEFVGKFFNAIYETARHMKMPRVTFLALSQAEQQECFDQGYDRLARAIYSIYTQKKRRPFSPLRDIDEMEAGLFEISVDPLIPYYEMKVRVRGIDDVEQPKQEQKKSSVVTMTTVKRSVGSVEE